MSLNNADCHLPHILPLMVLDAPSFLSTHPPSLSLDRLFSFFGPLIVFNFPSSHRDLNGFLNTLSSHLFFFFFLLVATSPDVDRGDPDDVRGLTITALKESDNSTSVPLLLRSKNWVTGLPAVSTWPHTNASNVFPYARSCTHVTPELKNKD